MASIRCFDCDNSEFSEGFEEAGGKLRCKSCGSTHAVAV